MKVAEGVAVKVAEVQVVMNYGQLVVGSDERPEFDLLMSTPPASDRKHVLLPSRAQIAPVRVQLWRGVAPEAARRMFSGETTLATGRLTFREASEPPFFSWPATAPMSTLRLTVATDLGEEAADVTVVVDPSPERLPDIHTARRPGEHTPTGLSLDRLDQVLNGHGHPAARLAIAVEALRNATAEDASEPRIRYGLASIVEWMRWLHPRLSPGMLAQAAESLRGGIGAQTPRDSRRRRRPLATRHGARPQYGGVRGGSLTRDAACRPLTGDDRTTRADGVRAGASSIRSGSGDPWVARTTGGHDRVLALAETWPALP
ncbi:hypothetical protein AB0I28_14410 [Phytomonospora sp. NPDC050363]|uniref:hypothetical protein n=1 Tax=Phytomonospora sp. NPDC050363 TaxID=3155642 RepID=UPI0033E82B10